MNIEKFNGWLSENTKPKLMIINGHTIDQDQIFNLGSWLNNEITSREEIKTRIEMVC